MTEKELAALIAEISLEHREQLKKLLAQVMNAPADKPSLLLSRNWLAPKAARLVAA